jgi:D-beta-D-heptose 7-phosphate kinase/D-beta-D-heptose 1-phosphate adenosyltransferase
MIETIQRDRLEHLLSQAGTTRIAVVGDAMLDIYLRGDVDRISPEAPVPVVRVRDRKEALGGAANVAQNVMAIGAQCELVCVVGNDAAGRTLQAMCHQLGAEVRSFVTVSRATTTKTRVTARAQQLLRFDEEDDTDLVGIDAEGLRNAIRIAVSDADALVLEDYNKGVLTPTVIHYAMEAAQERGIPIIVDPKYRHFFEYRGATVFKPNRRELESALGAAVNIDHPETLPEVLNRLGVSHLLLTLGEAGMVLVSQEGEVGRVPTTAREVYDVVGAGDTVTAYLAAILAAGGTVAEAAVIANFAAGVEVGKLGAATVSPTEVIRAYEEFIFKDSSAQV